MLLPSDEDGGPWAAWFHLLSCGFLIFNQSISDVQFLLEGLESEMFRKLLLSGPDAFNVFAGEIRERISEERRSQDEQYALDRIAPRDGTHSIALGQFLSGEAKSVNLRYPSDIRGNSEGGSDDRANDQSRG